MNCLSWLLIAASLAYDYTGQTYSTTQSPSETNSFTNCVFEVLSSDIEGGGLRVNGGGVTLTGCTFRNCHTTGGWGGGAFFIKDSTTAALIRTSGISCTASSLKGGFGLQTTKSGTQESSDVTVVACGGSAETYCFDWTGVGTGPTTAVSGLNSTGCHTTYHSSALMFNKAYSLNFQFSVLTGNTNVNCIAFADIPNGRTVRCFGLFNNTCQSASPFNGLFGVYQDITVSDSVLQGNRADWLIGSRSDIQGQPLVTFVRCVLEQTFASTSKHSVSIATTSCITTDQTTWLPTCLTRTQSPPKTQSPARSATKPCSATRSKSPTRTQSPTKTQTPRRTQSPTKTQSPAETQTPAKTDEVPTASEAFTEHWETIRRPMLLITMSCFVLAWTDA